MEQIAREIVKGMALKVVGAWFSYPTSKDEFVVVTEADKRRLEEATDMLASVLERHRVADPKEIAAIVDRFAETVDGFALHFKSPEIRGAHDDLFAACHGVITDLSVALKKIAPVADVGAIAEEIEAGLKPSGRIIMRGLLVNILKRHLTDAAALKAENERLKSELEAATTTIESLRGEVAVKTVSLENATKEPEYEYRTIARVALSGKDSAPEGADHDR